MHNNTLYYGDNLEVLRKYIPDRSVDLIYLDPPFNSKADYNILFKEPTGEPSRAQITAFEDTWHWTDETERTFKEIIESPHANVIEMMRAFRQFVGQNDMMAYLTMMCIRLIELRRALKDTGSIYLHCDPTASHYLKVLMDTVFGKENFRNEVIWKRSGAHGGAKRWGPIHDTILFYSKTSSYKWNRSHGEYDDSYIEKFYRLSDEKGRYQLVSLTGAGTRSGDSGKPWRGVNPTDSGRHWAVPNNALKEFLNDDEIKELSTQEKLDKLDELGLIYWPEKGAIPRQKRYLHEGKGVPIQDVVTDINPISSQAAERLGYPTQKPETLLERIVRASSNENDIVLDPFCGCGTTITVAQRLGRNWIGIDITHLSINLIKWRMKHMFYLEPKKDYDVIGEPEDLAGAIELAGQNRYQFQWWALSLIDARPYGDKKKGSDEGIDGYVYFYEDKDKVEKGIVSVKSGKVGVKDVRDLGHVIDREKAKIGLLLTLQAPTRDMKKEALNKGFYKSEFLERDHPRIQILTIEELLSGKKPDTPPTISAFKRAQRAIVERNLEMEF